MFILDKTLTPQSMDYPRGLSQWTTQKWTTLLKIRDQGLETEWIKFQVSFSSIVALNGTWLTQFANPDH